MGDPSLAGRKVFKVFNQDFIVDERYTVTKELGQGAYGIVCAASNNQTGEGVAIKKVTNVFSKKILASAPCARLSCCSTSVATGTSHACMIWTFLDRTTSTRPTCTRVSKVAGNLECQFKADF